MTIHRKALRQGDVLVLPIKDVPTHLQPVAPHMGRLVLAYGEVTGHHHSLALSDRVAMFREDGSGSGLFLSVSDGDPAALEHQEHKTLLINPGNYRIIRQRVMHSGMAQRVGD